MLERKEGRINKVRDSSSRRVMRRRNIKKYKFEGGKATK